MNTADKTRVNEFHAAKIERWGPQDPKAVGYFNAATQEARFEVIARLFNFDDKTVLDVGCGNGQLKKHLSERYKNFIYMGIDQQAEFITYAKNKYKNDKQCEFILGDFSTMQPPQADVVVCSGALSYRCDEPGYYSRCIQKLFSCARDAFIFNVLDRSMIAPDEHIICHDVSKVAAFCQTLTQRDIVFVTKYIPYDVTFMLTKTEPQKPPYKAIGAASAKPIAA